MACSYRLAFTALPLRVLACSLSPERLRCLMVMLADVAVVVRRRKALAGGPVGSRHRQQLNGEFIAALLRDFRHGGPKAIERVRRTQPAAYLKILALLVPREHKVEHSNPLKGLTDEQLEAMIEYLETSLAAQAGGPVKVIEATAEPALEPPKPKNRLMLEADTAVGPRERKPRKVPSPAGT